MLLGDIFDMQGRRAVVTGASSGLGERFARVLAPNGAQVLAAARRLERLEALAAAVPGIVPCRADLLVEADRAAVVERAIDVFGSIDVLVNNAGYGRPGAAVDEPIDWFRELVEINLVAVFELARLAAKHMISDGRGSIINVASMLGLVSAAPIKNASYTAAKGAVENLTRELACQWARRGVRINALAPGYFPSEALAEADLGDLVTRDCPMGRIGAVHELDGALLFLASDASTYSTGQTLVDGGWTAR